MNTKSQKKTKKSKKSVTSKETRKIRDSKKSSVNSARHTVVGNIAKSYHEIKKGLMFRKENLASNEGLLFDMGVDKVQSFWMKNTFIPLDVLFLNSKLRVIGFVENTTPHSLDSISIGKKSSFVLEVNAGFVKENKVKKNDYIDFHLI